MSDMPALSPARPRRRWLLFLSLAFNLFLLGVVVTGTLVNWQNRAMGIYGGANPFSPRAIAEVVTEAERARAEEIADATRAEQRSAMREVRRARMAVYRLLDEPYERARMEEALAAMRKADERLAMIGQETVLAMMDAMSPQARAAIAAEMRERARERHRNRERGGPRHGRGPDGDMMDPPEGPPGDLPEEAPPPPPPGP